MKDTMTKDLNEATSAEAAALATHNGLIANLVKANSDMVALKGVADDTMGANDLLLSTEKPALVQANEVLASDTSEKSQLLAACKSKAAVYDKRVSTRANEDAALAKAVEILDSDDSFGSFQKTTSTKINGTGSTFFFLQEVSTHSPHHESDAVRAVMKRLLSKSLGHSSHKALPRRLKHVMSTLAVTSNPFDAVVKDVDKMVAEVDAEAASDAMEMGNCQKTRIDTEAANVELNTVIRTLNGNINTLTLAIETPDTGDTARLLADREALAADLKSQADQTKARSEENAAYQQNIKNLMTSKKILNRAIEVLKKFYDTLATAFIEEHGGEAPPATFTDGAYAGQGGAAGAANDGSNNVAVTMLTTIRTNTANEVEAAHRAEQAAQTAFEDAMNVLVVRATATTVGIEARISDDDVKLTNDQAERQSKNKDKKAAEESLAANLALLASIKPGCDYIYARAADPANNVLKRDGARAIEKGSLIKAERDLKNSVAYKYAQVQKVHASYGECAKKCVPMLRASHADFGYDCQADPTNAKCVGLPDHVNCLACSAATPVKGYCAGHENAVGCAADPAAADASAPAATTTTTTVTTTTTTTTVTTTMPTTTTVTTTTTTTTTATTTTTTVTTLCSALQLSDGATYTVQQKGNQRYLTAAPGPYTGSSKNQDITTAVSGAGQDKKWVLEATGSDWYITATNDATVKYMDAREGWGYGILQHESKAGTPYRKRQKWTIQHLGHCTYTIKHKNTGRYLDNPETPNSDAIKYSHDGSNAKYLAIMTTGTLNSDDSQKWIFAVAA